MGLGKEAIVCRVQSADCCAFCIYISNEVRKIDGHSAGILNTLVLSRHILILLPLLEVEPKTHLHSAAD